MNVDKETSLIVVMVYLKSNKTPVMKREDED